MGEVYVCLVCHSEKELSKYITDNTICNAVFYSIYRVNTVFFPFLTQPNTSSPFLFFVC